MKKSNLTVVLALLAFSALADNSTVFDGGWRISAGAVYDAGVKMKGQVMPRPAPAPSASGRTRAEAEATAGGTLGPDKVRRFSETGAWIDTADHSGTGGQDPGKSSRYMFPYATWNGDEGFLLGEADYSEDHVLGTGSGPMGFDDESGTWGFNVELSRNLYHDEDYGWGVDMGLAFQYFRCTGLLSASSLWNNGSIRHDYGTIRRGVDFAQRPDDMYSILNWKPSFGDKEYYGSGDDGYSAPIDTDYLDDMGSEEYSDIENLTGGMTMDGDYEDLELMLLFHPYYDVFDWLRINTTLGVVVSRQSMEMSFTMLREGRYDYRSNSDFSQWDVYGVAGGGLMLYWNDFTLSADFLARFLDEEMSITSPYYRGSVQRGRWMFKISAGYEF